MKRFVLKSNNIIKYSSNMVQMNLLEYMYFNIKYWGYYKILFHTIKDVLEDFLKALANLILVMFYVLFNVILIPFLLIPFSFDVRSKVMYKDFNKGN